MKTKRAICSEGIPYRQEDPSKPGIYTDKRRHPALRAVFAFSINQANPMEQPQRLDRQREEDDFFQRPGESFDDYVKRRWQTRFLD